MKANLLRNLMIISTVMALLSIGVLAYGRYNAHSISDEDTVECCMNKNNSTEMPWEVLTRRLIGAVSL